VGVALRVIVTGGSGFIGSALVRHLVADTDAEVINLDKLTYAAIPEALAAAEGNPRYRFQRGDVADGRLLRELFARERPDLVMHLAAESHVDRSIDAPADFVQTNIVGTYVLLNAALEYWHGLPAAARARFRFHHVSTDEVFGSLGAGGRFTEESRYAPSSPYAASKAAADHLVRAWARTYGLPVVVSNCSNNYGEYQFPEKLIPLMILNALSSLPLPIYGSGENVRDWLYVGDHVRALWLIATRGSIGETYNVGGGAERTNLQVAQQICDIIDALRPRDGPSRRDLISFVPDRPGHDYRYAIDAGKLARELGWRAQESFESGLRRTVEWYLTHQDWWIRIRRHLYQGERLGLRA
jgi:dTDP-glucose 4,6-dehydratase